MQLQKGQVVQNVGGIRQQNILLQPNVGVVMQQPMNQQGFVQQPTYQQAFVQQPMNQQAFVQQPIPQQPTYNQGFDNGNSNNTIIVQAQANNQATQGGPNNPNVVVQAMPLASSTNRRAL